MTKTTTQPTRDSKVFHIAFRFSDIICTWHTAEEMRDIISRNEAEEDDNVCHSHDFCDANEAMLQAFEQALGREMHLPSEVESGDCSEADEFYDMCLWNDAWGMAKQERFYWVDDPGSVC